jgi:hypothetical protein
MECFVEGCIFIFFTPVKPIHGAINQNLEEQDKAGGKTEGPSS